jgi:hypothetical protein
MGLGDLCELGVQIPPEKRDLNTKDAKDAKGEMGLGDLCELGVQMPEGRGVEHETRERCERAESKRDPFSCISRLS